MTAVRQRGEAVADVADTEGLRIAQIGERIERIEDVLSLAATGTFEEIEVANEDRLASVEAGMNLVLTEWREEMENTRNLNENLDLLVDERTSELQDKLALITEQNELITRQQVALQELSTPILRLWDDVIALPIIGIVDTRRSAEIMEKLLSAIMREQARFVILDITGVEVVDTKTADHFIKVVKATQLLGARCVITGIRPAVAQTLVDIGVDLSAVRTLGNLMEGLKDCIRTSSEPGGGDRASGRDRA